MKKLLIVDDCGNIIRALYRLLNFENYEIFCSGNPSEALQMINTTTFDVVLTDQRMPGMSGVELLGQVEALQPDCVRICMSGFKDFEDLMTGFNNRQITHFVQKPWDNSDLKALLASYLTSNPGSTNASDNSDSEFIYQNEEMAKLLDKINLLKGKCTPVFIHGETGTGKELVARAIHRVSKFSSGKFVAVNCNNLSETLLESQLFGHRKGAFTGAVENQPGLLSEAHNGTLFLDEVTDLPYAVQCKLLRVLQEREYTPVGETQAIAFDAQIISAGSTRLETAVQCNGFRADLMYRLDVFPLNIPPLRARGEDVCILFKAFTDTKHLNSHVAQAIKAHCWPGNIRELQNAAIYALTVAAGKPIGIEHLPDKVLSSGKLNQDINNNVNCRGDTDRENILNLLARHNENKSEVARQLGISRMSLWRQMKRLEIQ